MELADFSAGLYTQLGIQVRERLIKENTLARERWRDNRDSWRWPPESSFGLRLSRLSMPKNLG